MKYNRLGRAGIKVSELSYGSWVTFGKQVEVSGARALMRCAHDAGVNFFDNAEAYANGLSESLMGEILPEFRREELVVSTKIFWGGDGPNDLGHSRKRLIEGTNRSLRRLRLDYVDLLYCHRFDKDTPVEETVLAMDSIVRSGKAFYWGTSEWPADRIAEAYRVAREMHCVPPTMEQPEYNLFNRERVEREYAPLYADEGLGTTTWSPLLSGLLTGKYQEGIPPDSRLGREKWLRDAITDERLAMVEELSKVAADVGCTLPQLSIAWCLRNGNVSTVILGASSVEQLRENLGSAAVKKKLTGDVLERIEAIVDNRPTD